MIAVLGDQDLREETRRRQSSGDWPLGRRRLRDVLTGPAAVFRADDADDLELGGYPVEHFTDVFPDRMQSTAAAGTDEAAHIDDHVFAGQMVRQRLAARMVLGSRRRKRRALLHATDIGAEVFKNERQLIRIEPFGSLAELHALELLDRDTQLRDYLQTRRLEYFLS